MEIKLFDVIIVGAGAAGLIGALEIALTGRSVAVIEAKEKPGGRIITVHADSYPIELGAEFVHGDLPATKELLKKAGIKTYPVNGSIWQHKDGQLAEQNDFIEDYSDLEKKFKELKTDVPVADFFSNQLAGDAYEDLRFSLKNYVQGYYAADIQKASTFSLREELTEGEDEQYRIEGGYGQLVTYLEKQGREKGVQFFFSQTAKELRWSESGVDVLTTQNSFRASKAIVTVSIGVLQADNLRFSPALPEKLEAARRLGFGQVQKIILHFEDAFWKDKKITSGKDLSDLNFLFSEEAVPTWWSQHPKTETVLVGWLGGPPAKAFDDLEKEDVVKKALHSLSQIFGIDVLHLSKKLKSSHWHNWSIDDCFCGTYSYEVVSGESFMKTILQPVQRIVYFAGEGLHHGPQIGTVEAALQSGRTVAQQLIAQFGA